MALCLPAPSPTSSLPTVPLSKATPEEGNMAPIRTEKLYARPSPLNLPPPPSTAWQAVQRPSVGRSTYLAMCTPPIKSVQAAAQATVAVPPPPTSRENGLSVGSSTYPNQTSLQKLLTSGKRLITRRLVLPSDLHAFASSSSTIDSFVLRTFTPLLHDACPQTITLLVNISARVNGLWGL